MTSRQRRQEQKNMLKQQRAYKVSEDRLPRCQSLRTSERQGNSKGKGFVDLKNSDHVTDKVRNEDDLIKYMKNPPGYLQRTERLKNFQGKVLSFGVLDWERLEKWKHAADGTNRADSTDVSSRGLISSLGDTAIDSFSHSSCNSMKSHCYGEEKHPSFCSSSSAYHKGTCFQEYESPLQGNTHYADLLPTRFQKRLESDQKVELGGRNSSSNMRNYSVSLGLRENSRVTNAEAKKRMEERGNLDAYKQTFDKNSTLSSSSVNSSDEDIIITPNVQHKTSFRTNERKTYGTQKPDLSHHHQCRKPKDIVLLRPRKYALDSHAEEHRASVDENLVEKLHNNFSAEFQCEKAHSGELGSRIPHSCPLIFSHRTNSRPETSSELLSETSKTSAHQDNRQDMKDECSRPRNVEHRTQNRVGNSCLLDQEMSKETLSKGRHPLPNRRFSFSFGQMGRSFSFKESSSLPASSSPPRVSVKSGPLTSNASAGAHHSTTQVKRNGHNRTRSSPLRRILDPLLRSKSENLVPSKEVSSSSSNMDPTVNKSPENLKQDNFLIVRALLQFTVRNGIHLFQFVVDDENTWNNNVLAATMKNQDSSTLSYTFYSVKEVKKKSGSWLGQGNKEKNHGFAYDIVGHMRLHTSFTSDYATQRSESVLFDAETNQCDQSIHGGELAAVVDQTHRSMNPTEYESSESHSTAVIIPGGIHTAPKDGGVLSPLIDRWSSGGVCDCGGWDIGCKLRVLHNLSFSKALKPYTSNTNSFQFFDQERDRATFRLVSQGNGFHSVEFDSSISLIQAFFISLTVINRQNSNLSWDASNLSETKVFQQPPAIGDDPMKRKPPVKYASNPPVSPVGRV